MTAISNLTTFLQATKPASSGIDVSIWKWVIVIGVTAVVIFWGIKRVADIVVNKKTDEMIRNVGEDSENKGQE